MIEGWNISTARPHRAFRHVATLLSILLLASVAVAADTKLPGKPAAKRAPEPALLPVEDVPSLPRVLLIGDSISMGYTLQVRELLKGKANVHHPAENCSDTRHGLAALDKWLGKQKWDVIHFNFGLHDLKYLNAKGEYVTPEEGKQVASLPQYEQNLRQLIERLKKTGAKVIWCSTAPVPEGAKGRVKDSEDAYNAVAAKVAAQSGIAIDDLHAVAKARQAELQRPHDVHFTAEGYQVLAKAVAASILAAAASPEDPAKPHAARWPAEKAWRWYADVGPIRGCNFLPRTAVNTTEMWQKETFDPGTIDEELGWAQRCGINSVRVFIQYIVYEADPRGLIQRMERFLEIADRHHISAMIVLLDDCFIPEPKLGRQPDPIPGVHNSQWTASPGNRRKAAEHWPELKQYVVDVLTHFGHDRRVLVWDLYNEAAPPSRPLVEAAFAWAREAKPSQPLTSCWQAADLWDVASFHDYGSPNAKQLDHWIAERPALCTECIARGCGSRFETVLPALAQRGIGWYMWGLVKGRIQTYYPWGSPKGAPEPKLWHHDLLQPDGTPYRSAEIDVIRGFAAQFRLPPQAKAATPLNRSSFR